MARASFTQAPGSPIALGGRVEALAMADLDADGELDLAVPNYDGNTVAILLGNGSGGFTATGTPIPVGTFPDAIRTGDFNADGRPDLVVAGQGSNDVRVLIGDGTGGFTATAPVPAGTSPRQLAVADFDRDGEDDVAVVGIGAADNVRVLLGNGSGGLTAAPGSPFSAGKSPLGVTAGDVNGDGRLDLATANYGSNDATVLLGNGSGGFTPAVGSPFPTGERPEAVTIRDLDGDAHPDLAVANQAGGSITVLLGNGSGGFAAAAGSPVDTGGGADAVSTGDFNGDGVVDLAVTGVGVGILLGNGAGAFAPAAGSPFAVDPPITSSIGLAVGDVDDDGRTDVVFATQTGIVNVLRNTSAPVASLSAGSIAFGTQPRSTLGAPQPETLTNTGDYPLHVGDLALAGANASDFLLTQDRCSGRTLLPGAACTVQASFAPRDQGPRTATLVVASDAAGSPQAVSLTGTGTALPTGPAGPQGPPGPQGLRGSTGKRGPKAKVRCSVTGSARPKLKCKVTYRRAKSSNRARVALRRSGRTYARGSAAGGTVPLRVLRPLGAGRYTLVIRIDGRPAQRLPIRLA